MKRNMLFLLLFAGWGWASASERGPNQNIIQPAEDAIEQLEKHDSSTGVALNNWRRKKSRRFGGVEATELEQARTGGT